MKYAERQTELLESFLLDAWDALNGLSQAIEGLGGQEDAARLKEIGILAHRLKGTAALYRYPQVSKAAELIETLSERGHRMQATADLKAFFEQVAVCLSSALERIASGAQEGELGLELSALGGAELFARLLADNRAAFAEAHTTAVAPQVASELPDSVAGALRASYLASREDWEFFEAEALEHLERIEQALEAIATGGVADDHIAALFRATHTLKGAAYMMGVAPIGELAHALEELMVAVRDRARPLDEAALAALYRGSRLLGVMLEVAAGKQLPLEAQLHELEQQLAELLGRPLASAEGELSGALRQAYADNQDVWPYVVSEADSQLAVLQRHLTAATEPDEAALTEMLSAAQALKATAEMIALAPFAVVADALLRLVDELRASEVAFAEVRPLLLQGAELLGMMLRVAEGASTPLEAHHRAFDEALSSYFGADEAPVASDGEPRLRSATIRVSLDKLELLMNLAGDVVTLRSRLDEQLAALREVRRLLEASRSRMLRTVSEFETYYLSPQPGAELPLARPPSRSQGIAQSLQEVFAELEFDSYNDLSILARSVAEMASDVREIEGQLAELSGALERETETLRKLSRELRNGVAQARMVPMRQLFGRLKRLLQDAHDKRYQLMTSGEAVEIDATILEEVLEPLLHLVRNAITHGIEPVDARLAAGKAAEGTIALRAYQQGNSVIIEVEDDGRGIDVARVKAQAVRQGFKTPAEIERLSDEQAQQLIFLPGLSTAEALTADAGRGVGMDAVTESVRRLGGEIALVSVPGQGTRFTLKLPLTLIVSEALFVGCAGERYAVPANTVERLLFSPPEAVAVRDGMRMFAFEGGWIPYYDLAEQLGLGRTPARSERTIAVLKAGLGLIAVEVDELFELEEIVVRGLERAVMLPFVAGATISASGQVVLILDPAGIAQLEQQPVAQRHEVAAAAPARGRLLLVDDSVSVRRVLSRLLSRANYQVVTAGDGQAAFDRVMAGEAFDAILTDLEMPIMSGYELIELLRYRPETAELPIIVMTSRAGEKHRSLALELGASDYFAKPIDERLLLARLEQLTGAADYPAVS